MQAVCWNGLKPQQELIYWVSTAGVRVLLVLFPLLEWDVAGWLVWVAWLV